MSGAARRGAARMAVLSKSRATATIQSSATLTEQRTGIHLSEFFALQKAAKIRNNILVDLRNAELAHAQLAG